MNAALPDWRTSLSKLSGVSSTELPETDAANAQMSATRAISASKRARAARQAHTVSTLFAFSTSTVRRGLWRERPRGADGAGKHRGWRGSRATQSRVGGAATRRDAQARRGGTLRRTAFSPMTCRMTHKYALHPHGTKFATEPSSAKRGLSRRRDPLLRPTPPGRPPPRLASHSLTH
jgi:hypothetical protein